MLSRSPRKWSTNAPNRTGPNDVKKTVWIVGEAAVVVAGLLAVVNCGDRAPGTGGTIGDAPVRAAPPTAETSFGVVPDFAFTDQDGHAVTRETFDGRPYAVAAIFTTCTGPCPKITAGMRGLQDRLIGTDVQLVSVSVDPETDTPEVLTTYAANYTVDTGRWTFLTGDEEAVYHFLRDGLWLPLARADGDVEPGQAVTHSTWIVAIDRHGMIRGWYDGVDADELEQLEQRLRYLASED